jgi:SAM-dependent methyltransferase
MFDRLEGELNKTTIEPFAELIQAELLPYIQLTEIGERSWSKPRGYAGDYLTIEMVYENRPKGVGRIGPLLDSCLLNRAGVKAVRNRRNLLAREINATLHTAPPGSVQITSLACGPAREIFDVFEQVADKGRLTFTCIDIDEEALVLLKTRCEQLGLSGQIRGLHGNLIYLAMGRQELQLEPQDFIYSIGLIDYFNDDFVVNLMDWIYDKLRIGGRVILGNFHPRNPTKGLLDHVLDWRLIHRTEADMDRLYQRSKFGRPCSRVVFEEEGINLFAECKKE